MTKIDHIALVVGEPTSAARWYEANFNAEILYSDETWALIQFENIKMAFEVEEFDKDDKVKKHRDDSNSVYKKDPWGNIYELINYEE